MEKSTKNKEAIKRKQDNEAKPDENKWNKVCSQLWVKYFALERNKITR